MLALIESRAIFSNLEKLGANISCRGKNLKKQLAKICIYPAIVGAVAIFLDVTIKYGNDSIISSGKINAIIVNLCISLLAAVVMYCAYKLSLHMAKMVVGI